MITGELKRRIDTLWTEFWQGGITNPLTVIEQITFLMFARLLDITETRNEPPEADGQDVPATCSRTRSRTCAGQKFRHLGGQDMLPLVRDKVFPHFRKASTSGTPSPSS